MIEISGSSIDAFLVSMGKQQRDLKDRMKSRRNYLKFRKNQFKWKQIGWHSESVCARCGQKSIYLIEKYDALCCISCNEWLEKTCSDPDCPFCSGRPETPHEAYFLEDMEVGSAGRKKLWRRENYQHKTDGMRKHEKRRAAGQKKHTRRYYNE